MSEQFIYRYYRGRVALYSLLKAMNIGEGSEVLLQAFTCVANPEAILATGATPIYVDIESGGVNMNHIDLNKKISPETRAIVIQHTFGIPADLNSLLTIAENKNIPVIEDCCHTLISQYNDKNVGNFGVGSYYSFEWGKPIVAGIGGALKVNDLLLEGKVKRQYDNYRYPQFRLDFRLFSQYLLHKLLYRPRLYWPVRSLFQVLGKMGVAESNYNPMIMNQVANDFSLKMPRFSQNRLKQKELNIKLITEHSNAVSFEYSSKICSTSVKHIKVSDKQLPVYCRYPLISENKEDLLKRARVSNIEVAEWYSTVIHPLKGNDLSMVKYSDGCCPNAEERCKEIITLPTHLKVGQKDIDRTLEFLNNVN